MPSGTVVAEFAATPQQVWNIITDLESTPAWVPDLVSVRALDQVPMSVGSKFNQVMNVQGRKTEVELTIQEFDPPRTIAHVGKGKSVRISGRTTIQETPGGCKVTNEWGLELSGMLRLAAPLAGAWTRNNIQESMKALKERLQQG